MSLRIEHKDGRKIEFGVMGIPHRKNKALVAFRSANIEVLAYFRNDECAADFDKLINNIVDICNPVR